MFPAVRLLGQYYELQKTTGCVCMASRLARADEDVEANQILLQVELKTCYPSLVLCSQPTYCPRFLQGVVLLGINLFLRASG